MSLPLLLETQVAKNAPFGVCFTQCAQSGFEVFEAIGSHWSGTQEERGGEDGNERAGVHDEWEGGRRIVMVNVCHGRGRRLLVQSIDVPTNQWKGFRRREGAPSRRFGVTTTSYARITHGHNPTNPIPSRRDLPHRQFPGGFRARRAEERDGEAALRAGCAAHDGRTMGRGSTSTQSDLPHWK